MSEAGAYRRQLQRQQTHEDSARQLEGYRVWFDAAVPQGSGPALDYGAGRGQGVGYLRERGHGPVVAYEPNAQLARELGATADRVGSGPELEFLEAEAGRFALILCKDVLEHLERDETVAVIRGLLGGLAPGGRLVVSVPHAVSFVGQTWRYADFTHRTAFTEGSLRYVLEAGGAQAVDFFGPRFRLRADPRTLAYRALKRGWHLALRAIYTLEDPGNVPPHFHPRLVASARAGGHADRESPGVRA